jgi:CBS domain containing-hemolysin-like protein
MAEIVSGYRLLIVALAIVVNGLFSAAQVALVAVRRTRLKQLANEGNSSARAALNLLADTERLLTLVQVGVTACALTLGWAGLPIVYSLVERLHGPVTGSTTQALVLGASFAVGFLFLVFLHAVLGEVVPKNVAVDKAERLALLLAPPLLVFGKLAAPFVYLIEHGAAAGARLFGVRNQRLGGGHSAEELRLIITSSLRHGNLESFEERAFQRLLDVQDLLVREIMVPRSEIVSVPVHMSFDDLLPFLNEHKLSRVPVYEDKPEEIVGIVHYKDLLTVWHDRRTATERRRSVPRFSLRHLMTRPFVVPETKPLNQLIDDFRREHSHMALVVDEFGTVVGLVTLEDALEQIFGEIEDEHDAHLPPVVPQAAVLELDGATSIRDLEVQHAVELPVDAGFETLAGYLLYRLGFIPRPGDTLESDGYLFTILEMDKKRIAKVKVETLEAGE